ncbi:MAG: hypothetical protein GWO87_00260 [Xanthomonadaceae bacterium]|nr:hypothetical protein [Rhodospirillaceae bacterium]NIA17613.1 hypothetical protein [Xanthomonadaceae bacterium]
MNTKTIYSIKQIKKIGKIEKDILMIKKTTIKHPIISLKGILKGVVINEKNIQKAKKSVFKTVKI